MKSIKNKIKKNSVYGAMANTLNHYGAEEVYCESCLSEISVYIMKEPIGCFVCNDYEAGFINKADMRISKINKLANIDEKLV